MLRNCLLVLSIPTLVLFVGSAQADVFNMGGTRDPVTGTWTGLASLEFVTVGDPGNLADQTFPHYHHPGSVAYSYQMGKYDVTVGQYCEFLNAVAKTDTYGLYDSKMATDFPTIKIVQSGSAGDYSYSYGGTYSQGVNCPVFDITWNGAARFCNWLTTGNIEDGVYKFSGGVLQSIMDHQIANTIYGKAYFIPTEDEWYKAAYYKGGSTNAGYWKYPTQSDTTPSNILSSSGMNNANFYYNATYTDSQNKLTTVGAFASSPGVYGTFDMGGLVTQWTDTPYPSSCYVLRGGAYNAAPKYLSSDSWGSLEPTEAYHNHGFRVASVPEPGSFALLLCGLASLLYWRRQHTLCRDR